MYMNRNEVDVTLGRADEYEDYVEQWSGLQVQNAGFVGGTLLQSYACQAVTHSFRAGPIAKLRRRHRGARNSKRSPSTLDG
jgi:hypothetical protein